METAAIYGAALGLRSGWRSQAWRWSPPPRPVPSATGAWPWPARPASPRPRSPGGMALALQPGREGTLGWLLAGAGGRDETPGRLGLGRARSFQAGAPGGRRVWPRGGRSGLLKAAVWLSLRSREETGAGGKELF